MNTLLRYRLSCTAKYSMVVMLILMAGCTPRQPDTLQGYVEGEYIYISSPLPGTVVALSVLRGDTVQAGDALFQLDTGSEVYAQALANYRIAESRALVEDIRKGKRPSEIEAIEAQLSQSRAAFVLSSKEYSRQSNLFSSGDASVHEMDAVRAALDRDQQRISELEAVLKSAQQGSRSDQIIAAEANVHALETILEKANWDLAQKVRLAPTNGLVFETYYQAGEWVAAGRPVVAILPPENIKVRTFVPQPRIGAVHIGDRVTVHVDGIRNPFNGKISFISPSAEYTPPVIYSQHSRDKLVFMVEATFDPDTSVQLHPGQPVDVRFEP
jgi:HlyD family secretion protein